VRRRSLIVGLCVLAIGVRLVAGMTLVSQGGPEFVLSSDDGDAYDAAARWQALGTPIVMTERMAAKWDASSPVETRWPQGYWLFLGAQYRLFGSPYVSTLVLQALLAAGGVLAAYALAASILGEAAALVAGFGQAVSSTGVYLSAGLFAESVYIPLVLGGLALTLLAAGGARSSHARSLLAIGAGVLFGVAEAARPLALAVFGVATLWAIWACTTGRRDRLCLLVGMCAGFGLALLPFIARDLLTLGRLAVFTAGGAEALRDQTSHGDSPVERVVTLFISGGWVPLGEPAISSIDGAVTLAGRSAEWILAGIGLCWLLLRTRGASVRSVWLLVASVAATLGPALLIGLPLVRYRAVADPIFIIWMVAGTRAFRRAHL
jgi:hypothetical protein